MLEPINNAAASGINIPRYCTSCDPEDVCSLCDVRDKCSTCDSEWCAPFAGDMD